MNEFIVWDKKSESFRQIIKIDFVNIYFQLESESSDDYKVNLNDLTTHTYIGKTDINDKKIYADCSIVEFEYNDDVFSYQATGYFTYDSEIASYVLIDDAKNIEQLSKKCVTNIKVIGTLQENPELL